MAAIEPLTPQDPHQIGRFRLVGRLGAGGMGVVYAGLDAGGRRVAVKVVRPDLAHDPDFRQRFAREVTLVHRVGGRCVARVVDADPDGQVPWFATEYIPGPTLDQRIEQAGPMSGDELHGLATGLAEALLTLHSRGIVHRDLKPSNLILAPDGPRVVDFGIARALDETSMTRTGLMLGSSGWISPEHYRGEEVGPPADVYAWGLIVYYAATGVRPYGRDRPEVVAARVLNATLDTAGLPDGYREMVGRAVDKDPRVRQPSPELLDALATPLGHSDPVTNATRFLDHTWAMPSAPDDPAWTSAPRRPSRRKAYLVGGGALATAALVAALVFVPSHFGSAHAGSSPSASGDSKTEPATTPTPSSTALQGSRVENLGLSYIVPLGWTSSTSNMGDDTLICVRPQEFAKSSCGHGGLSIQVWAKGEQPEYEAPHGWATYGDVGEVPGCVPGSDGDFAKAVTREGVTVRGTRPVAGRTAVYREYRLDCRNGFSSTPRLWWLPSSGVLMETIELPDRYRDTIDAIAKSIDLTNYRRPDSSTG
ncbi:serine/threonine-protein kinase [Actinomadura sp. DC4]|uniref:serine/threonine-protein kinase n=1 Tax=Actinomadura sp. DC4 TaxID=3055069 RepID=UPI0025AF26ED|nr:serine/threonine-protein kinase [Actinomadura sp. DC4]MDN3353660.1 serine/threonine-protein kinase [Actinomadura sp. DC4]